MTYRKYDMAKIVSCGLILLFFYVFVQCKKGERDNKINNSKLFSAQKQFDKFHYQDVLDALVPHYQSSNDTSEALAVIGLSSSRLARFYIAANQYNMEMGKTLHNVFDKNKALITNRYYPYFGAMYFGLSGEKKKSIKILASLKKEKSLDNKWKNAIQLTSDLFKYGSIKNPLPPLNSFNRQLLFSLAVSRDIGKADRIIEKNIDLNNQSLSLFLYGTKESNAVTNFLKLSGRDMSPEPVFREKIGHFKGGENERVDFYQYYYNPTLYNAYAHHYGMLALRYWSLYNSINSTKDDYQFVFAFEIAGLFAEWGDYESAISVLKGYRNKEMDALTRGFINISGYIYNQVLKKNSIEVEKKLESINSPILRAYFLWSAARLDQYPTNQGLKKFFNFSTMSDIEQLVVYEYLGNYYLCKEEYEMAQLFYQKRLVGGSFDLDLNDPIFLLHFSKAYNYNEINKDQGLYILRKMSRRYPQLKPMEHINSNIVAEKYFK